jgi:hypothetical protein
MAKTRQRSVVVIVDHVTTVLFWSCSSSTGQRLARCFGPLTLLHCFLASTNTLVAARLLRRGLRPGCVHCGGKCGHWPPPNTCAQRWFIPISAVTLSVFVAGHVLTLPLAG